MNRSVMADHQYSRKDIKQPSGSEGRLGRSPTSSKAITKHRPGLQQIQSGSDVSRTTSPPLHAP